VLRQIEVSSQLNLAIADYQKLLEEGNAEKTTLTIAQDPDFKLKVIRDDTKAIQVCRKDAVEGEGEMIFYIRV
jgi:hypothetical protein